MIDNFRYHFLASLLDEANKKENDSEETKVFLQTMIITINNEIQDIEATE